MYQDSLFNQIRNLLEEHSNEPSLSIFDVDDFSGIVSIDDRSASITIPSTDIQIGSVPQANPQPQSQDTAISQSYLERRNKNEIINGLFPTIELVYESGTGAVTGTITNISPGTLIRENNQILEVSTAYSSRNEINSLIDQRYVYYSMSNSDQIIESDYSISENIQIALLEATSGSYGVNVTIYDRREKIAKISDIADHNIFTSSHSNAMGNMMNEILINSGSISALSDDLGILSGTMLQADQSLREEISIISGSYLPADNLLVSGTGLSIASGIENGRQVRTIVSNITKEILMAEFDGTSTFPSPSTLAVYSAGMAVTHSIVNNNTGQKIIAELQTVDGQPVVFNMFQPTQEPSGTFPSGTLEIHVIMI